MTREEEILKEALKWKCDDNEFIAQTAFEGGAKWADEHPKSPWISVKDKLPLLQELSLVVLDDGSVSTARLTRFNCEDCWEVDAISNRFLDLDEVIYWMPIPGLPEGGEG